MTQIAKIPTLNDLLEESTLIKRAKDNALIALLNQEPPEQWKRQHPLVKVKKNGVEMPLSYLPIERIYFLLHYIYGSYKVVVKSCQLIANSIVVTVNVTVKNPITGSEESHDGVGAAPLQTDKGAGATEFDKIKSSSVQMAAPAAESYAIKDACEKFGKIFGRDLNVSDIDYMTFAKDAAQFKKDRVKVSEGTPQWQMLVRDLINGKTIDEIEEKVELTEEQREKLMSEAL